MYLIKIVIYDVQLLCNTVLIYFNTNIDYILIVEPNCSMVAPITTNNNTNINTLFLFFIHLSICTYLSIYLLLTTHILESMMPKYKNKMKSISII